MFYTEKENILRFGDVITNIVDIVPVLDDLPYENKYKIDIKNTKYFTVISPCCSIEKEVLSVSPMYQIRNSLFENEYFLEDFTRLNTEIEPENTLPKTRWEKLPEERRQQLLEIGRAYAFYELFIYQADSAFDEYDITTRNKKTFTTRNYMIDFRNIFYIESKKIQRGHDLSSIKLLQLSINSRKELRDKLTHYFSRIPDEDRE